MGKNVSKLSLVTSTNFTCGFHAGDPAGMPQPQTRHCVSKFRPPPTSPISILSAVADATWIL
ncbi:LamB/YcsF family protein [Sinorhizobium sp. BJ1]|uniref:LamB/YcsF family protein n=1 Tax=Sinorhizobium sp. BJ1 TaxID=2035455 RepID=UPI0032AEC0A9